MCDWILCYVHTSFLLLSYLLLMQQIFCWANLQWNCPWGQKHVETQRDQGAKLTRCSTHSCIRRNGKRGSLTLYRRWIPTPWEKGEVLNFRVRSKSWQEFDTFCILLHLCGESISLWKVALGKNSFTTCLCTLYVDKPSTDAFYTQLWFHALII